MGDGYEARHISLWNVFVVIFGLDPGQATIGLENVGATDQ